ncbi:unnamed protein product [Mytilus edulis]|uniref:Uncharacterized protein n=1 Tax=Mytilus edulis TaxID=6550 RepID=A0A8S3QUW0_MYTED|nr:unnamed protein product [Mytilus edulis]
MKLNRPQSHDCGYQKTHQNTNKYSVQKEFCLVPNTKCLTKCYSIPDVWQAVMGGKASSLIWCEYNPPTFSTQSKPSNYLYCYKLPPPSYNYNWTDLHYAASHGNVRRIQEIIHKSGTLNLNKKDYYGKTPLYWAAYKGHKGCVEELLKFGASVNTKCRHGGSPLHAVVSLYPECALLLIKHGADVNLADNWGVTPMYLAATSGQIEVMKYLLASVLHRRSGIRKLGRFQGS